MRPKEGIADETAKHLLVEDDAVLRHVVARNLRERGYMVQEAATFREAAEQLAIKPALLLLDIGLPDASGWDVARWLEQIADPVPIIIISGQTPDARRWQHFHPVAFLPKPFVIGDLLAAVAAQLPHPSEVFGC